MKDWGRFYPVKEALWWLRLALDQRRIERYAGWGGALRNALFFVDQAWLAFRWLWKR